MKNSLIVFSMATMRKEKIKKKSGVVTREIA